MSTHIRKVLNSGEKAAVYTVENPPARRSEAQVYILKVPSLPHFPGAGFQNANRYRVF